MNKLIIVFASLLVFSGCSTLKAQIYPKEDGTALASVRAVDQNRAEEVVYRDAKEYCAERGKQFIFIKKEEQYTGTMDEETRNTIRKASTVAVMMGGAGTHNPVRDAGYAGHVMTSDRDYLAELSFKCQ